MIIMQVDVIVNMSRMINSHAKKITKANQGDLLDRVTVDRVTNVTNEMNEQGDH